MKKKKSQNVGIKSAFMPRFNIKSHKGTRK